MDSLSWLVKENVDARLVILCALINDIDQLQSWTDDFVDQITDSEWVEQGMEVGTLARYRLAWGIYRF